MPDEAETVIGFDFGSRWTGIAVGQTLTGLANPLPAIKTNDWAAIARLISDWQPSRLIVGLPTSMDGSDDEMTGPSKRFSRRLQGRFHLPTELHDERLTTRAAWQIAADSEQRYSKQQIDSLSAVLITESWLASQRPG